MEKDKMIQKLANDIAFIFVERMTSDGIRYETIAEMLIDMDYRKVPEGAVVLTKEELDNKHIFDDEMFLKVLDAERGLGRKEAAREILEKVGNIEDCGGIPLKQYQWFVDLCKKHGVEMEE